MICIRDEVEIFYDCSERESLKYRWYISETESFIMNKSMACFAAVVRVLVKVALLRTRRYSN